MNAPWTRHAHVLLAMVGMFFFGITPAMAEKHSQRETRARAECLAGRVQAGIDLLAELFAETHNPTYIFNQGRCFEQNGKPHEAILRFREFLRKAQSLSAAEKAGVKVHIDECQAELDALSKSVPTQPPPVSARPEAAPAAAPPSPAPEPAAPSASAVEVAHPGPESETGDGSGLRIAGIVTASVGVAVLAGGVVLGVMARNTANEVSADAAKGSYSRSKDDQGKLYAKLQWVGYGVGAAGILAGGALYYFGYRASQPTASVSVSLSPMLWPGGSGVMAQGRF